MKTLREILGKSVLFHRGGLAQQEHSKLSRVRLAQPNGH
jgi:hypothetical protein